MAFERALAAIQRLLDDLRFALGAAVGAAGIGAVSGALASIPSLPVLPRTAPWANRLVAVAELALTGWLAGLVWGVVVAGWSHSLAERSRPRLRRRAAIVAGLAALAAAVSTELAHLSLAWVIASAAAIATGVVLVIFLSARERS